VLCQFHSNSARLPPFQSQPSSASESLVYSIPCTTILCALYVIPNNIILISPSRHSRECHLYVRICPPPEALGYLLIVYQARFTDFCPFPPAHSHRPTTRFSSFLALPWLPFLYRTDSFFQNILPFIPPLILYTSFLFFPLLAIDG